MIACYSSKAVQPSIVNCFEEASPSPSSGKQCHCHTFRGMQSLPFGEFCVLTKSWAQSWHRHPYLSLQRWRKVLAVSCHNAPNATKLIMVTTWSSTGRCSLSFTWVRAHRGPTNLLSSLDSQSRCYGKFFWPRSFVRTV